MVIWLGAEFYACNYSYQMLQIPGVSLFCLPCWLQVSYALASEIVSGRSFSYNHYYFIYILIDIVVGLENGEKS